MFALIGTIGLVVVAVIAGAVGSYLFLRANPAKKAVVDAETNKISKQL